MRLALISDIHANVEALEAVLADIERRPVDRVVCLGDIVGYNTNPGECLALLRGAHALCIAGNHDRAVCGQITTETFNPLAARAAAWTRERLDREDLAFLGGLPLKLRVGQDLIAVHGAFHPETGCELVRLDNDERRQLSFKALMTDPSAARIGAFGHTHDPAVYQFRSGKAERLAEDDVALRDDAYYLVNPGTVGQPRGADRRAGYAILDLARRTLAFRRVPYDTARVFAKTRKAGLAPPLWFLPQPMRQFIRRTSHLVRF